MRKSMHMLGIAATVVIGMTATTLVYAGTPPSSPASPATPGITGGKACVTGLGKIAVAGSCDGQAKYIGGNPPSNQCGRACPETIGTGEHGGRR